MIQDKIILTCDNGYGKKITIEMPADCSIDSFVEACRALAVAASFSIELVNEYFPPQGGE